MPTTALLDAHTNLSEIRGLADYWASRTGRALAASLSEKQTRLLLDTLGLGIEQAASYLGTERPDYPIFEAWILATAGEPDPLLLARYDAWLDGAPPPEAERRRQQAIDAMAPVLEADAMAQWEAEGFVILRAAITPDEAKAAEALLWRQARANPDDPDSWYQGPRNNGIMVQYFQDPALEPARRSARVHKAFAQLWGTADLWMTVDRMSFNPPEGPGRPFQGPRLHWDVSLALPIPFATQGILYLTDTSADQGALELVPGFQHRIEGWLDGLGDADPREVDLSGEARTIAAGAGDLIIWRQDLPHGASPNCAERPRMAQYINMYSAELESHPVWR
ncbi:MAG: phytanoyl-CoA dioxygenase family protein [Sphingomonas bacterium]